MNKVLVYQLLLGSMLLYLFAPQSALAQCVPDVNVPNVPGLYPDSIPPATGCQYYEQDVTFVFPRDTTISIAGNTIVIPFISFTIDSVTGIPQGMDWACNLAPACEYIVHPDSANADTFGCVRFFGIPNIPATYPMVVHFTALADALGNPTAQPATFAVEFVVDPCSFEGDCYALTLDANCAPATLNFSNQIPSGGDPNFSYAWAVSSTNGFSWTETAEEPADLSLVDAGTYIVTYQADIDTIGFFLDSVSIQSVNCDDLIGDADLYWYLMDPSGDTIVNTLNSPVDNGGGDLPLNAGIGGFVMDTGTYTFEVWDADDFFGDDECSDGNGGVTLTIPSAQTGPVSVTNNGLTVIFGLSNPIQTVTCSDTLEIFAAPAAPLLTNQETGDTLSFTGLFLCENDTLFLHAQGADSLQWYLDGQELAGETDTLLAITGAGVYYVEAIAAGSFCRTASDQITVDMVSIPAPAISLDGNSTLNIDMPNPAYTYTWLDETFGFFANGTSFAPTGSGNYYAVATDTVFGCTSGRSATIQFIPTRIDPLAGLATSFHVYPNPNEGQFTLRAELFQAAQAYSIQLTDLPGRVLWTETGRSEGTVIETDLNLTLPAGMYVLTVALPKGQLHQRVVIR